jgi:hypothetical protein
MINKARTFCIVDWKSLSSAESNFLPRLKAKAGTPENGIFQQTPSRTGFRKYELAPAIGNLPVRQMPRMQAF